MNRAKELKEAFYKRDFERRVKEKVDREDWIAWAKGGEGKKPTSPNEDKNVAEEEDWICEDCDNHIDAQTKDFSISRFGRMLCKNCQWEEIMEDDREETGR